MKKQWSGLTLLLLVVMACHEDPNLTKWQYMPDMADTPTVKPHRDYLDPPPHSVATEAPFYAKTPEEAETKHINPFAQLSLAEKERHIKKGEGIWKTYCIVCHGPKGNGEGYITDKYPRAPDLNIDMYKQKKDGFFFHRITFGAALMPSYGHSISIDERWQTVMYLRTLQNGGKL